MRFLLIMLTLLATSTLQAESDKAMRELFTKYDLVMKSHKTESVDEIFTTKFLKASGGKEEFIEKVKELPKDEKKSLRPTITWKKGVKDDLYYVDIKDSSTTHQRSRFIVIKEAGKLKIDGTLSDG